MDQPLFQYVSLLTVVDMALKYGMDYCCPPGLCLGKE